eukprot:scaffold374_cov108-Isochrysis_galbana.AAC.9
MDQQMRCDEEERKCLQEKGKGATWYARHVAGLLHARHYFTHAAATDGSLKANKEGVRKVAYGVYKGIQPGDTRKGGVLFCAWLEARLVVLEWVGVCIGTVPNQNT